MATVNDNDPRVEYTATASQTTFTRPFFLNAEADLDVYVNGTLTASGYTHTGVGANSGTIVFSSGRTAGDIIILHRTTAPERSSAYSDASPLPASSLEDDATRALLLQQEAARDIRRAIHAPVADTELDLELPSAADRASKFPVFDADGNITTSSGTGADAGLRTDLASTASGEGAALVGIEDADALYVSDDIEGALGEVGRLMGATTAITPPGSGFSWLPFDVLFIKPDGKAVTTWNIADNMVAVTTRYYVDYENGSDSNDGLLPSTAFKTLAAAYATGDYDEVVLLDGRHLINSANVAPTRSHNLISLSGNKDNCILQFGDVRSWSAYSGGPTGVVTTTIGSVSEVFDASYPNEDGDHKPLTLETSIANVQALPGSWFWDSGTSLLYVHTHDERLPDENIRVYRGYQMNLSGSVAVYIQGIGIEGGGGSQAAIYAINTSDVAYPTVYMEKSSIKYARSFGVDLDGGDFFADDCDYAYCRLDNLNYHALNGRVSYVVEQDCRSRHSGWASIGTGPFNNNGSSNHDGGKTVRINGEYKLNQGPNVIDTGSDAETWCVGTESHDCLADAGASRVNFHTENKMYLDTCVSYGSSFDLRTAVNASAQIAVRDLRSTGTNQVDSGTTGVTRY